MKKGLKIAIIGAGSTYTPELIEGFIQKKDVLPVRELVLMDIEDRKLKYCWGIMSPHGRICRPCYQSHSHQSFDRDAHCCYFVLAQIRVR
jgi:6-phospho-beta-glucosidase